METDQNLGVDTPQHSDCLEAEISKQLNRNKTGSIVRRVLGATSLMIPKAGTYPKRNLLFTHVKDDDKALFYRIVVAAYNYAFTNEFATISAKPTVNKCATAFVEWLNTTKIIDRYKSLKEYEAYMFDKRNNHGGISALSSLKTLFYYAFEDEEFDKSLKMDERIFLQELLKTKVSPNTNKRQISLASYFGALEWLRDEDKGVGTKLYNAFASPKLTVKSMKCLASVMLLQLYEAKVELRAFLLEQGLLQDAFDTFEFNNLSLYEKRNYIGRIVHDIVHAYHANECPSEALKIAVSLVLLSNAQVHYGNKSLSVLDDEQSFQEAFLKADGSIHKSNLDNRFKGNLTGVGLSLSDLYQLANQDEVYPITKVESLMFNWLMACFAVQPSDIPKLTKDKFRLQKVGGKITHLECEYFKGRANAIHNTRTVSSRTIEGKALLTYFEQHPTSQLASYEGDLRISSGIRSLTGMIAHLLNLTHINKGLSLAHKNMGDTPMIMPLALKAVIEHGVNSPMLARRNMEASEVHALLMQSDTACPSDLFGLQSIKNSAVHAYSDPYTLHYLINRNSHTNQTEKDNYLNNDNEEWINASGRVTRSVMLDLINNVFELDFADLADKDKKKAKVEFNNEFASVTDAISYKSEEMFARLKVVTGQEKGVINEVGVLSHSVQGEEVFAPIYVLDSPVTVCKIRNYIYELEQNYKKLLCSNPDFLYQTALPTVEWMERVLSELSRESVQKGDALFKQMQSSGISMSVFHSI